MNKLKIGNTIKTALRIYRDRFKKYYRLAFTNSFWLFVPLYGWAKYAATMGLLARLAYGDVAKNSETIKEARRHIKPKMWLFFGAGLMETYVFYLKILLVLIPLRIIILIIFRTNNWSFVFDSLFWILVGVFSFGYYYWVLSHLFLYELPLAIDNKTSAAESRKIAWKLVNKSVIKLQVIIFSFSFVFVCSSFLTRTANNIINRNFSFSSIANLLEFSYLKIFGFFVETLFVFGALFIPNLSSAIGILFKAMFSSFSSNSNYLLFLSQSIVLIILQITVGALFIPFWQSLKAVVYYQLILDSVDI